MDFLDPKAKRRHTIRLFVGYGLMATLISIVTLILVFQAYGFDVDRKTGEVIQNGLVFVDSAPDRASVILNNQEQKNKTNDRFALPSGDYDLRIRKDGYREWHRDFTLNGGEVERFTYPLLVPTSLKASEVQAYDVAPLFVSQSPDRRWTIMSQANSLTSFVEYDLESLVGNKPAVRTIALPGTLFTFTEGPQSIELVEWSSDNKHLLVKHTFADRTEFVVISRDQPATSVNINNLLGLNPTSVTLRDKKFDQWHLYTQQGGLLQAADTKKTITTLVSKATTYKAHGSDTLLYAIPSADPKNQQVMLKQGDNSYLVKEVPIGNLYLDIARYDGSWYVVVGSDSESKTYIYRDPINVLQKRDGTKPTPRSVLKTTGAINWLAFSQNTRFIVTQSSQHFEVYDAELNRNYKYNLENVIDGGAKTVWMDGHRMLIRSGGKVIMFDFDGSNKQELTSSVPQAPAIFDRDYKVMYSVDSPAASNGKSGLYSIPLRTPADK